MRITAHAGTATAAKSSAAVGPVMRAAPTATTPPEAIGDAVVGEQLTADPGLWSDQSATFSYTWQRCDATGICTTIDGATDSTYTVVADDLGQRLRVEVTATNTGGTNTTDSVPTTIVVPAPPSVVTAPSVTGDATVGSTLTADPGSWSDPSATFAYAWQRCDDSGACTPINSADAATYTLGEADLHLQIRVEVTATNAGGTGTADAAATAPVTRPVPVSVPVSVPVPPTANSAPSIGGDATVGSTLTADPGSWSDPSATFAYAWQRCDDSGACTPINSADAATYTLGEADLHLQIRVEVTATGVASTTGVADSGLVGPVVLPPAPAVVAAPSIIGGATVGSTLTARPGSWSGPPPTFAYAWQRCDTTGACTLIDNATTSSYVLGGDDLDRTLRVEVTATNAGGTGSADSVATAPVALPPPPSVVTVPSVSGDPVVGTTLTADAGSWSGPPPTVAYAWQRCDTTGACTPIDGATSTTYALDSEDVGRRIRVEVTATNAGGASTTDSNPVGPVTLPPPPSVVTPPSVSGDATVGSTLIANPGSWSDPSATLSYAWQRCDASGVCSGISQATGSTHTVATVDVGQRIRVEVTATNPGGASSADSAATASITLPPPPSVATPPSLSGDATVGSTLTANPGSWNGPSPTFAYVWQRCDGAGACTTIDGATGTSYTPTAGDAGLQIAVQVTATNAGGAGTATSAPTAPIAAPPPAAGSAGP